MKFTVVFFFLPKIKSCYLGLWLNACDCSEVQLPKVCKTDKAYCNFRQNADITD